MGSEKIKTVFIWIIAISMAFALNSCVARKAEKSRLEETTKNEVIDKSKIDKSEVVDSNIKESWIVTKNNRNEITTTKKTVEPVDATKPSSYTDDTGKKKELNNAKETTETVIKKNNNKTESLKETAALIKTDKKESEQKDIKDKEGTAKKSEDIKVERDKWSMWNLAWLLLAVPVYWLWKNKARIAEKMWWI